MRTMLLCIVCCGVLGCSTSTPPPSSETTPARRLPEDVPMMGGDAECLALKDNETLLSVSPEGFAWLGVEADQKTHIRVLDPLNMNAPSAHTLDLVNVTSLHAWSDVDASLVANGQLWRLDDLARVNLNTPASTNASLCGSLIADGFVLSGEQLMERRESSWWRASFQSESAPARLLERRGECLGPDGVLWAIGANNTLWRVDEGVARVHAKFGALTDAVSTMDGVYVLDGSTLWVGSAQNPEAWSSWDFENNTPTQLTANTREVWVQANTSLWRLAQGKWQGLRVQEAPRTIRAHDDGLWWVTASQVCHHKTGSGVRLEGVRPFERTRQPEVMMRVSLYGSSGTVTATINGQPLPLQEAGMDTWQVTAPLDKVGWHVIEFQSDQDTRTLPIERLAPLELSWGEDIQPLYQVHCSECHGGPDALSVDLSTHALWVSQAGRIKTFVVDAQTMPPPASRKDAWSDDAVRAINQWLNGSQNP